MRVRAVVGFLCVLGFAARAGAEEGEITVRVTDETGHPIPSARMRLIGIPRGVGRSVSLVEASVSKGEARIAAWSVSVASETGPLTIEVYGARDAGGAPLPLAPASYTGPRPPAGVLRLAMERGLAIDGAVADEGGTSAPPVFVFARPTSWKAVGPPHGRSPDVHASAVVGPDGSFRLVGLDDREYELWLGDAENGVAAGLPVATARGGAAGIRLTFRRAAIRTVWSVDPRGKTVRGAGVRVTLEDGTGGGWAQYGTANARGGALFADLDPKRKYRVSVEPPYNRDDLAQVDVHDWVPVDDLVVQVPPGRTVRGTVVDARGVRTRAWVHYRLATGRDLGARTTDPEGGFDLHGMPAETLEMAATPYSEVEDWHSGTPDEATAWTPVPPGVRKARLTVREVTWPLPTSRQDRFTVRVVGPDGSPPSRVEVDFGHWSAGQTLHASGGVATVEGAREKAFLRAYDARDARGDPLPWAPTRIDVPASGSTVEVHMRPGRTVEGRVTDERGVGLPGVPVLARDPGSVPHHALAETRTGTDGRFRFVNLGDEDVDIGTAETTDGPASAPVLVSGGAADVRITVRRSSAARVRVVDEAGRPVAAARFTVMQHFGPPSRSFGNSVVLTDTGTDGVASVPALDPTLHLSLDVRPPATRDDLAPLEIDPWKPGSGDVVLPPGYVATLRVVDSDGRPLAAGVHRLVPAHEPGFDLGGWGTEPDPDAEGRVTVRGLPRGSTWFQAYPKRESTLFPATSPWVEVSESRREVELRVPTKGSPMTVRAEGATASTHGGYVFADIGGPSMPSRYFEFEGEGVALVGDLAPGRFVVFVLPKAGAKGPVGRMEVAPIRGEDVRVPMVPAAALRVRVDGPPGLSRLVGFVAFAGEPIADLSIVEGTLLGCDALPPGRYAVSVFARAGEKRFEGKAFVATGSEGRVALVESED